ncbi:hypothetical protein NL108_017513 [Boleophthalmus pectinirostris]|nr:hypothetical protein NL108_017513 [Boleophthalmus pectinirostris]
MADCIKIKDCASCSWFTDGHTSLDGRTRERGTRTQREHANSTLKDQESNPQPPHVKIFNLTQRREEFKGLISHKTDSPESFVCRKNSVTSSKTNLELYFVFVLFFIATY